MKGIASFAGKALSGWSSAGRSELLSVPPHLGEHTKETLDQLNNPG
jgi:hypothetical protein